MTPQFLGVVLAVPAVGMVCLFDTRRKMGALYAFAVYLGCCPLPIALAVAHDAGGRWWYALAAPAGLAGWYVCSVWLAWMLLPPSARQPH